MTNARQKTALSSRASPLPKAWATSPRRTGTQEIEGCEDDVEEHRPGCKTSKQNCITESADYCHMYEAE